jgi:hypothetical protein
MILTAALLCITAGGLAGSVSGRVALVWLGKGNDRG